MFRKIWAEVNKRQSIFIFVYRYLNNMIRFSFHGPKIEIFFKIPQFVMYLMLLYHVNAKTEIKY